MISKILSLSLCCLAFLTTQAQETHPLTFSGYAETYYSYDIGNPQNHERPGFIYSHKRHNEVNINIAFLKMAYATDQVRGNVALMAGNYAQYNLAAEDRLLQPIYEANAGFKLSSKHNLWLDAGIMPSHIGFESAIGKDCWTLTRSMMADNSPYYEAGIKLGYTSPNEKVYVAGLLLNGWQRIGRINNQQTPAFGTQLTLKPTAALTLNWSSFVGNEFPGDDQRWRVFNNFYGIWQATSKLGLTAGFDIGVQEKPDNGGYDNWWTPVLLVRYSPSEKWRITARGEYYADADQVIVLTSTPNGFRVSGASLNIDYLPKENVMLRFEGKFYASQDEIFEKNSRNTNNNAAFTTALAISF